jgi:DNA-binding transcriptional LysR family regulator
LGGVCKPLYIERHGRPERPEDINDHAIIDFSGDIANLLLAKWLRSVAPRATIAARSNSVIGLLMAAKSGVGVTILPVQLGDPAEELIRVIDPLPGLMSQIYILVHPDLRHAPRVRAFFDFVVAEIGAFRPMLLGKTQRKR